MKGVQNEAYRMCLFKQSLQTLQQFNSKKQ